MKTLRLLVFHLCFPSPAYGFSSASIIPMWADLQSSLDRPLRKVYVDEIPSGDVNLDGTAELPILYRDKECICASSQTVWLAMECKNIDYITVLVSKEDDQRVPRVVWPGCDDDVATNSEHAIEILEQIQARYPDVYPPFYPKISAAVDASRCNYAAARGNAEELGPEADGSRSLSVSRRRNESAEVEPHRQPGGDRRDARGVLSRKLPLRKGCNRRRYG